MSLYLNKLMKVAQKIGIPPTSAVINYMEHMSAVISDQKVIWHHMFFEKMVEVHFTFFFLNVCIVNNFILFNMTSGPLY